VPYKPHSYTYEENTEQKSKMDARQTKIKELQVNLLNMIIENQVTLSRWKVVHSILLFKDKTNKFIHRTQNINIYEADYNMILKIKWSEAMKKAEIQNTIHTSQFGCRKRKTAHDPVFIEIMQHEITRLTRQQYSQINFEAQACFNIIIPNIAIQVSKKYGIHDNICKFLRKH
jgi:hypothetical protein